MKTSWVSVSVQSLVSVRNGIFAFWLSPTCETWRVSVCSQTEMSGHGFLQWLPVRKLLLSWEVLYRCVVASSMGTKWTSRALPACDLRAPLQWGKLGWTIHLGAVSGFDWEEKVENGNCCKLKTLKAVILMYLKCFMVVFQLQLFKTQTSERWSFTKRKAIKTDVWKLQMLQFNR